MVQMYVDLLWEFIPADALQDVDPQPRGGQGDRLGYIKCRSCGGRAVCMELDDGTRIEFRITVPHRCDTDEIEIYRTTRPTPGVKNFIRCLFAVAFQVIIGYDEFKDSDHSIQ